MEATMDNIRTVSVQIPQSDWQLFDSLAREHGWKTRERKPSSHRCGIDRALEDVAAGRIFHAEDTDDLFNQILG